ncbi:MAG: T9SS type A sorting domain-containing protein [Bacteroidetes bacterium]|nr:T9SS type A sorting domain-containing protein [Bacteroidota bacterium]
MRDGFRLWVCTAILVLSVPLHAQWRQTSGPGGEIDAYELGGYTITPNSEIIAAAVHPTSETVFHSSSDGGRTWTLVRRTPGLLTTIFSQPSGRVIADSLAAFDYWYLNQFRRGAILYSDDNGLTWRHLPLAGMQIWQGANGSLFGVDSLRGLVGSHDDGMTWTTIDSPQMNAPLARLTSSSRGVLLAEAVRSSIWDRTSYVSNDSGISWFRPAKQGKYIGQITPWPDGSLIGSASSISGLRSTDNGLTWDTIVFQHENPFAGPTGIMISEASEAGPLHSYWQSTDTNRTFAEITDVPYGVRRSDMRILTGGADGSFLGYGIGGLRRIETNPVSRISRITPPIDPVWALMSDKKGTVYAFAGDSASVWSTSDQGTTWHTNDSLYEGSYLSPPRCMALDSQQRFIGGTDWTLLYSVGPIGRVSKRWINPPAVIDDILVHPNGMVFAASPDAGVLRSTDSGMTWNRYNRGIANDTLHAIALLPGGNLVVAGKDTIYQSSDLGVHWKVVAKSVGSGAGNVVRFLVSSLGTVYAATDRTGAYKSVDNGSTWSPWNVGIEHRKINALIEAPNGTIVAATDSGVYLRNLAMKDWMPYSIGLSTMNILSLCFDPSAHLYAGSDVSGVFVSVDSFPEQLVVIPDDNPPPSRTMIQGCFPNPAATTCTLRFQVDEQSRVSIELFDELGRTVRSEDPFDIGPGIYEYDLSRNELPYGTYYVRLREGERVETRSVLFGR